MTIYQETGLYAAGPSAWAVRLRRVIGVAAGLASTMAIAAGAHAADLQRQLLQQSHLTRITTAQTLRVCMSTDYFGIAYRNPASGKLEGFDVDMVSALADSLKAKLDIVETSFSTFVADLLTDKCDIGMFGIAATLSHAQAVEFSAPYMVTGMGRDMVCLAEPETQFGKSGIRTCRYLGAGRIIQAKQFGEHVASLRASRAFSRLIAAECFGDIRATHTQSLRML